jgi:hypothetical protein
MIPAHPTVPRRGCRLDPLTRGPLVAEVLPEYLDDEFLLGYVVFRCVHVESPMEFGGYPDVQGPFLVLIAHTTRTWQSNQCPPPPMLALQQDRYQVM